MMAGRTDLRPPAADGDGASSTEPRSDAPPEPRRWLPWAVSFGSWTLIGLFEAVPYWIQSRLDGEAVSMGYALIRVLPRWWIWVLLTPAVIALARRVSLERRPLRSVLLVHLPAGVALTAIHVGTWLLIRYLAFHPPGVDFGETVESLLVGYFALDMVVFWAILGGAYAVSYLQRYRERELEAARLALRATRLESRLAEARLHALTSQLRPHFLFNALNTVSELVRTDPERAERMVVRMGDLLRLVVERGERQEVPLREEIALAEAYLAIEELRHGEALRTEVRVPTRLQEARVPSLCLQPLVENAVRHGIGPLDRPGRVTLTAVAENGRLVLEVRDDGVGPPPEGHALTEGVGLGNTRRRLEELYGGAAALELEARPDGGAVARIRVPLEST